MLGRANKPETAEQILPYLREINGPTMYLGHLYVPSLEGPSMFSPFGGMDDTYFLTHTLKGTAAKIPRGSVVSYGESVSSRENYLHCVGVDVIGEVAFISSTQPYDGRHLAVGEGVLRILQGFDQTESRRLISEECKQMLAVQALADEQLQPGRKIN